MDNKQIEKRRSEDSALEREWNLMNAALERLGQIEAKATPIPTQHAGRLVVALDLTASRNWSLKLARNATAAMFTAIAARGSVAVKLVFFRGRECKAGPWQDDAAAVCRSMLALTCSSGSTKIGRVLQLVIDERGPLSGLVYIGDHCEEDGDALVTLADRLGQKHVPVWIFHECADHDDRWMEAEPIFKSIAAASGGAYCPFTAGCADALRELLSTIAVFSAAGQEGLKQIGQPLTAVARQLQSGLLLPAPERKQLG